MQAVSGGDVELPKLTTISGGPVQLESDGSGSTLNINVLTSLQGNTGQQFYSGLQATNHGTVSDAALATHQQSEPDARRHRHTVDQSDRDVHGGHVKPEAGTETYTGLTHADGSSLEATGGASLSFPSLASYAGGVNYTSTLEASGSGSTLLLPKLATLTSDTTNYSSRVQIEALAGGEVSLPLLTQITSGPVQIESDGSGSQLIAPALTTFQGHTGQQYISSLQETSGGIVDDPDLASINSVNLVGDASGTFTICRESRAVDLRRHEQRVGRNSAGSGKPGCSEHGHAEHPGRVDGQQPGDSDDSGGKHCRNQRQPAGQYHERERL